MTNKQTSKSIAVTPVIRAKTSAPAFVAGGHNHDDRYIRYDDSQAGISSDEANRLLENINGGTSATAKLVRADVEQSLPAAPKNQARQNIGIYDDVNAADADGNINVSQFGNMVGSNSVSNNDLLSHFVRYDLAQTITNTNKAQFATNSSVLSLLSGLSEQEIQSAVKFSANGFTLTGGQAQLNLGATIKGTPLNDTQATISIGAPLGTETAIINIVAGVAASTTVAMSCSNKKIVSVKDPENNQDVSTKKYVDDQITGLDLTGTYLQRNGENQMNANLDMGSNNIESLAEPTSNNHAATKQYVDNAGEIISGGNNSTAGGFTPASTPATPSRNGLHLVVLSGKVTSGTSGVLSVNVVQSAVTIATRYINTDGSEQWSLTIPVSLSSISDITVSGDAGVVFNQFDLVQFGY